MWIYVWSHWYSCSIGSAWVMTWLSLVWVPHLSGRYEWFLPLAAKRHFFKEFRYKSINKMLVRSYLISSPNVHGWKHCWLQIDIIEGERNGNLYKRNHDHQAFRLFSAFPPLFSQYFLYVSLQHPFFILPKGHWSN